MFCPECGKKNDQVAEFCSQCGSQLLVEAGVTIAHARASEPAHTQAQTAGVVIASKLRAETQKPPKSQSPNNATSSVQEHPQQDMKNYYRAFIGIVNTDYYLRKFHHFDANRQIAPTWHWPAFFVTFYWLIYRKLWLQAVIYFLMPFILTTVILIISSTLKDFVNTIITLVFFASILSMLFLPPMFANAIYYKHCKKQISELDESCETHIQLADLAAKGGVSKLAFFLVIMFNLPIIGYFLKSGYSIYQDHTVSEKVIGALNLALPVQDLVASYYMKTQMLPKNLIEAGFSNQPLPDSVKSINLYNSNKRYAVTITMNIEPIKDKVLYLIPSLDEKQNFVWRCRSAEILENYLPSVCHHKQI